MTHRPDIDGLRALAIISVVLFHAFPDLLPGGFVGVDIFFVISGYLITGIIIASQAKENFSLVDFYSRRIKRIFPALILMMACCLVTGRLVLMSEEYQHLGQHALAGAAYVSNFLLLTEAGYFDLSSESKPFLHLWSLSIEEQFYLVWPLALMLAVRQKIDTKKLTLVLLLASFLINLAMVVAWPTSTFYSPVSRAWELLVGASLVHLNLQKEGNAAKHPNLLAFAGTALIAWAFIESSAGMPLPGWWALFPTIGAACLIASGKEAWVNRRILATRLPVFIGLISYPLYLWHWPLLSFARIVEGRTPDEPVRVAIIVISLLFAWGTYRFVERPVRQRKGVKLMAGLGATLALLGFSGFQIYSHSGFPEPGSTKSEADIRFSYSLSWHKEGWASGPECRSLFGEEFRDFCVIHDLNKKPTAILLGDSNANHFFPGLSLTYAKNEGNLLNLGQGGCPPLSGMNVVMKEENLNCRVAAEKALAYAINEPSIKTVILSMLGAGYLAGRWSETPPNDLNFIRISSIADPALTTNAAILEHSMRITLARLSAANKKIVLLISVPMLDFDPLTCVDFRPWRITPAQLKAPCAMLQSKVEVWDEPFRLMVNRVSKDYPKVTVLDSSRELCDGSNCWALKDKELLYRDAEHLSVDGSKYLAERLMLKVP